MTLVLFGWLITQPYFKDLTNSDIRRNLANETMKDVHDDLLPAGFFDAGDQTHSMDSGSADEFESGFNDGRIW
jgi:hypothetical protein